ncbi:MAG: hypothetical protein HOW73_27395 [Polyangiaceae bacterium]|nr:hypothetical protein [Polyangiaceae bacterium]
MIGTKLLFIAATALMGHVSEPSDGLVQSGSDVSVVKAGRCAGTGCLQGTSVNGLRPNGSAGQGAVARPRRVHEPKARAVGIILDQR